jgi:hypothetical protein
MALWTLGVRESIPKDEQEADGSVKHDSRCGSARSKPFWRAVDLIRFSGHAEARYAEGEAQTLALC